MPGSHRLQPLPFHSWAMRLVSRVRKLDTTSSFGEPVIVPSSSVADILPSNKYKLPICTLYLPGAKIYIVNSASLIPLVQKQIKTLAFPPLEAMAAKYICGSSKVANDILDTNVNGEDGPRSYSVSHYPVVRVPLLPGSGLDAMNRVMAQKIVACIDGMMHTRKMKLFDSIRHEITIATTDSVYGPLNPFRDPKIEQSFWYVHLSTRSCVNASNFLQCRKFQPGIMIFLMRLFPSILARDSVTARETLTRAFLTYFKQDGHLQGSSLIKARYDHSVNYNIPLEDIARFECGGTLAILGNTSPAAFWLIYHVYSNATILSECRDELASVTIDTKMLNPDGTSKTLRTLDLSSVKTACPILLSTFQEVLRTYSVSVSARLVTQDHLLDGKYLLKKGATLMMPAPIQHTSADAFGPTVGDFDHRRFLPGNRSHNPAAFRAFGGGSTLCPGRHFATTEILAFTAMMILRCEVRPLEGGWVRPTAEKAEMWESTPMPDFDVDVEVGPRKDVDRDVEWRVVISREGKGIKLSAEDL